jgi:DNA-directed RNA polymerase specialized sigma subunit
MSGALHFGKSRRRAFYMANKVNQSKEYRIYIKESKSWVDVNKEFYTNYYRDINSYRKRQQEHGRCVCPASKRYLCDMDCMTCPYAKAGDQLSLDNTVSDGEGNEKSWLDDMPDESVAIAELMEDAELLRALYAKLNELDPEGRLICQLIMEGKSERDCGKEMGLSRNTFVYRRDKLFQKLRSDLKDYI